MTAIVAPEKPMSRWRKYRPRHKLYAFPVRIVPFLNVGIILWFFWWVTSSYFIIQPGFIVALPVAEFVSGATYRPMVVSITAENMVFFQNELLPIDSLHKKFLESIKKHPEFDATLVIQADGRISYSTIVRVMNIASSAGFKAVNLAVRPSFGESVLP